jgi:hypothetical protein
MKKVVLVGVVAILGLASCKKDYTCECVATFNDSSNETIVSTISKSTESNATSECNKKQEELKSELDAGENVTCVVK